MHSPLVEVPIMNEDLDLSFEVGKSSFQQCYELGNVTSNNSTMFCQCRSISQCFSLNK